MRVVLQAACLMAVVAAAPARAADGAAVFSQNCLMCHQSQGAGLAGQFPRLSGRVSKISAKPQGRSYLIDLLTYGMSGKITVDGQDIIGLMPPFAHIPDEELAAALNYVQALGDQPRRAAAPFTPDEIKSARARPAKTAAEVHAARQALGLDKLAP